MTRRISFLALLVLLSVAGTSGQETDHLGSAQKLLQSGSFLEAEAEFREVLQTKGKNFEAFRDVGIIAVLSNRLDIAINFLQQAEELNPKDPITKAYLAEAYYRQRDFVYAAPLFRALGAEQAAVKLESFKNDRPYLIEAAGHSTTLKFVTTDPLPVVSAQVNNSDKVNFLIDTGGGELILDPDFARSVGAREFGEIGSAASQGRIDSLKLGDFTIRNIPISILDTKRFSAAADGRKIDGIIGTVILYQFLATLDYPNDQLILEKRTTTPSLRATPPSKGGVPEPEPQPQSQLLRLQAQLPQLQAQLPQLQSLPQAHPDSDFSPFWMAGDHFLVTWASVNGVKEMVLLDTGLAGVGFTCPESTLKEIDVAVGTGEGGKPVPFVLRDLVLGTAAGQRVKSFLGPFPVGLETRFGFRIGGLISHEFFRNYAVTLDFDSMQLRLKKH